MGVYSAAAERGSLVIGDKIILKGMKFIGRHGVLPQERELGQPFVVDVELHLDLSPAGKTDDLSRTVDYARVYAGVEAVVAGEPCRLLETLAEKIAQKTLELFPVEQVTVRVKKPQAPLPGIFSYAAVEITRRREAHRDIGGR